MWVTPASPLFRMMVTQSASYNDLEHVDYPRTEAINNVMSSIPHAFYADKEAKYIIDKNLNWSGPIGVEMIVKYITLNVKIICPVRNILDILVSFDTIINSNPSSKDNLIDKLVLEDTLDDEPMADRRANWLMRHTGDNPIALQFMKAAKNPDYRHIFHFVDYDDLTTNPEQEINKIYDFLEIEKYNHKFENIEDPTGISKKSFTGINNLHKIRPKLEKKSRKPEDVLMPETIQRYSNLEFWKQWN